MIYFLLYILSSQSYFFIETLGLPEYTRSFWPVRQTQTIRNYFNDEMSDSTQHSSLPTGQNINNLSNAAVGNVK